MCVREVVSGVIVIVIDNLRLIMAFVGVVMCVREVVSAVIVIVICFY